MFVPTMNAATAPKLNVPSCPRFSVPARSLSISPDAANATLVLAGSAVWRMSATQGHVTPSDLEAARAHDPESGGDLTDCDAEQHQPVHRRDDEDRQTRRIAT